MVKKDGTTSVTVKPEPLRPDINGFWFSVGSEDTWCYAWDDVSLTHHGFEANGQGAAYALKTVNLVLKRYS